MHPKTLNTKLTLNSDNSAPPTNSSYLESMSRKKSPQRQKESHTDGP